MMNIFKKLFAGKSAADLSAIIKEGAFLVDVRTREEFIRGNVKNSINIPLDELISQLSKFKNKENIVVFCQTGGRSFMAKSILNKNGFNNVINGGSWNDVSRFVN